MAGRSQADQPAPGSALLPWLFPAMLGLTALDVLLSGRDLTQTFAHLERSAQEAAPLVERGALQAWAQRGVSMLLVVATLQRIAAHVLHGRAAPAPLLSAAFLVYWVASIAAPGLLGAHPRVSHEYAYPLLLGLACTMVEPCEYERILELSRNALFAWIAAGLPVLLVQPALVLDWAYTQGLLSGLPRYGGLANSPVLMGLLAQAALLVLWAQPFERRTVNRAAWTLGLAILFVAQSKTAWLAFLAGGACMWMVQGAPAVLQGFRDPRRPAAAVTLCLCVIVAVLAVLVGTLVLDLPAALDDFFNTREGAQLASLTGRDRIWEVALAAWRDHPVFGYGLTMWDSGYRHEVGLPQATHAHNQVIDTLGRAGVVGAAGLVVYGMVLLGLSLRHARAGRGLGLAMGVTVAILSVSEVPLLLIDSGSHLLHHYLLVVSLAAAAASRVLPEPARVARSTPPFVPVRRAVRRRTLQLPALGLQARRTVFASGIPLLLVVGSPLADGVPSATQRLSPAAAFLQVADPLRLTLATRLGSPTTFAAKPSPAPAGTLEHLAFERTLRFRAAATR